MNIQPNIQAPDEFYHQLVSLHSGLSTADSLKLNAKIILLLANQIGDANVLAKILATAKADFALA